MKKIAIAIVINLALMMSVGFMTMDADANRNSRVGGFFLSLLIPVIIHSFDRTKTGFQSFLWYGLGMILYVIAALVIPGSTPKEVWGTGLPLCAIITSFMFLWGNSVLIKERTPAFNR